MSKKTLTISIIAIIILALAGGVLWYLNKYQVLSIKYQGGDNGGMVENQPAENTEPEEGGQTAGEVGGNQEPEVITSDIDTSNWQTYRNEEYGFEVRYPEEWYHRGREGYDFYQFSPSSFEGFDVNNDFGIFITVVHEVDNTNIIGKDYDSIVSEVFQLSSFNYNYITKHGIDLNGQNLVQARSSSQINTFFSHYNSLFDIRFVPAGEISLDIYNAFILSFKFIES